MHIRCPHCQNAIEIVGDLEVVDVTCPSCGSEFNLLPATESYERQARSIGHFELIEKLGTGGFGTVWKARDTRLDRLVAVKIPRRDQVDPGDSEMFLREARAAAQLRHANIVAVHEVGREGEILYIVSDFVQGTTLADRLTAGVLPPQAAAALMVQVADALHHAHEVGVIHRDIKPQNIMLDGDGIAYLMDFGLAKREAGEITMTVDGKVLGTVAYMSPEQARGEAHRVDRRTDVYSLGVVLFELLTGERPFRGNRAMLLHQVINDDCLSPRKLNGRIPQDLATITLKCLEKDPHRRYSTSQQVADELRRYLDGRPIQARPTSRPERAWRWCRRNPAVSGLAAAVAASLLLGAGVSTWYAVQESARAQAEAFQRQRADDEAGRAAQATLQAHAATEKAIEQSRRAYRNYYVALLGLAQRDWDGGDLAALKGRLALALPQHTGGEDLRGFEWHYWNRLVNRDVLTLPHSSVLEMFPDGKRLATASEDKQDVVILDGNTGVELRSLKSGVAAPLQRLAIDDAGMQVAGGYRNGTVVVWQADVDAPPRTLDGLKSVSSLVFHQDGFRLAAGSGGVIKIWNTNSGKELTTLKSKGTTSLAFVDRDRISSASNDGVIEAWDIATGAPHAPVRLELPRHLSMCTVAFSAEGACLAGGCRDKTIKAWHPSNGVQLFDAQGHWSWVTCLKFSRDGTKIASAGHGDAIVKLWDTRTGQSLFSFRRSDTDTVRDLAFDVEGGRLAVGYAKDLVVYNTNKSQADMTLRWPGYISFSAVAFALGEKVIVGRNHGSRVAGWDASTGVELPDSIPSVSFDVDLGQIPVAGKSIATTKSRARFAFCSDRTLYVPLGADRVVRVYSAATSDQVVSLKGHSEVVTRVAFQPGNARIASGDKDGTIKIWETSTGQEVLTLRGHSKGVEGLAFNEQGTQLASASFDGTIRLWNATPREFRDADR